MINALIDGQMVGVAQLKTTHKGMPFVRWNMVAVDKNKCAVMCACVSFEHPVIDEVQQLRHNDRLTVTGRVSLSTWPTQPAAAGHALDVKVNRLMSLHPPEAPRHAHQPDPVTDTNTNTNTDAAHAAV